MNEMVEISKEIFVEITTNIPYKTSFVLGQNAVRYEGRGRKFKNALFAKQEGGKFYVIKFLVQKT
jgi:hypothetical protein